MQLARAGIRYNLSWPVQLGSRSYAAVPRSLPEKRDGPSSSTAEWINIMQQQLPAGHSLQPLLQPLLHSNAPNSAVGMPGDDVATIASTSTSLTVGMGPATTTSTPLASTDVEVPQTHLLGPTAPQEQPATQPDQVPAASTAKTVNSHWVKVVGVCAFAALLCYLDRTNISTAIVPMAEQYGWNKQFCGAVLSSFFAGYGLTQVLGGQLSDKYGGSAVLAAGLLGWSAATMLTPIAASAGTIPLLGARAMLGAAQGVAFPAMHALLAKHVPPKVRSGAIGIIMAFAHCGTAIGFGASPAIIDALGWGWSYYLFGGAALLWLPFWLNMGKDKGKQVAKAAAAAVQHVQQRAAATAAAAAAAAPVSAHIMHSAGSAMAARGAASTALCSGAVLADTMPAVRDAAPAGASRSAHPLLDAIEQQHLQQQLLLKHHNQASAVGTGSSSKDDASSSTSSNPNVGFWPLMMRKEVWAIAVAQYAAGWGFYGLLAWLPQFFIEHCGLQLSQLGGYTLAPYLLQAAVGAGAGILADNLIVKRKWSVKDVRVLMQVAGMLGPAACLFAAASPLSAHSPYLATGLITLGMGMSALTVSGVSASHLDIAPRHAGVVFGVGNTAGTLAGLVAVPGLGYVLQHTGNWSIAFGLAAAHNVVGAALWAKWAGDKPLPEDGGEPEAAAEPKQLLPTAQQQQHQPLLPVPDFGAVPATGAELKLKAA